MASPRKGLDRLNLRLHINEGVTLNEVDPFATEIDLLTNTSPETRSPEEINALYNYLFSHLHLRLFCNRNGMTNEHGIRVLAQTAQLSRFDFQRTSVWEAGDPASHFYIVLEGSVSIQVPFQNHIALATEKILYPGETFGEIGILNASRKRSAGIHTAQNHTSLLHIPREIFVQELGYYFRAKYEKRLSVLRACPAFKNWPLAKLKFVAQVIHERTVRLGDPVAKEGNNVETKFFINLLRRGQMRIDKKLFKTKNEKSTASESTTIEPASNVRKSFFSGFNHNKHVLLKKQLSLCVLSPGSILFEPKLVEGTLAKNIEASKIDRAENSTVRWTFSAIASTSCLLWSISRHTFYNIDAHDPKSLVLLQDMQKCTIRIPPMNALLATYYQQENWKKYKVRHLVDVYSNMSIENRKKLHTVSDKNTALKNKEKKQANDIIEKYMMDTPIFENESVYLKDQFHELSAAKQQSGGKVGNRRRRRLSSGSTGSSPGKAAVEDFLDLHDRRRRLLSKGDTGDNEIEPSNATHQQMDGVHQHERAVSALRKRRTFDVALRQGCELTNHYRSRLANEGRPAVLCRSINDVHGGGAENEEDAGKPNRQAVFRRVGLSQLLDAMKSQRTLFGKRFQDQGLHNRREDNGRLRRFGLTQLLNRDQHLEFNQIARHAFSAIDRDQDGIITAADLNIAMKRLDLVLSAAAFNELEEYLQEGSFLRRGGNNGNHNGKLNVKEFIELLHVVNEPPRENGGGGSNTIQPKQSITFIAELKDLLSTQPFVAHMGTSINSNMTGLLSTANLQTRIESNKYTYRVPSVMRNYNGGEEEIVSCTRPQKVRVGQFNKHSPLMRRTIRRRNKKNIEQQQESDGDRDDGTEEQQRKETAKRRKQELVQQEKKRQQKRKLGLFKTRQDGINEIKDRLKNFSNVLDYERCLCDELVNDCIEEYASTVLDACKEEYQTRSDRFALHKACKIGSVAAANAALAVEGCDVNRADYTGATALAFSCANGHVGVLRVLLKTTELQINQAMDDNTTPLFMACENGHATIVKMLLAMKQILVNQAKKDGTTPLHVASQKGHVNIVKMLLTSPDLQTDLLTNHGCTPLFLACEKGYVSVVRVLIKEKDVNINRRNNVDQTPINIACCAGQTDVVQLLLQQPRVAIHRQDHWGGTPESHAKEKGYTNIVTLLQEYMCATGTNKVPL